MGQQRTLPPDQHDPPRPSNHARRIDQTPDLEQPAVVPPAPDTPERPRYRGIPLDGTAEQLHRAVDLLEADTVGYLYYAKVIASQRQREQEVLLSRRVPEPLQAPRQGVER